ncbi:MAG TPA: YCF48-related protein [Candidatus Sulfotelmatobacter sp.]|nr:YCF48-related protein [Candidatus Sulfotelmatobacter sp.]
MEQQEPEPWLDAPPEPARARRAVALIAVSVLAIAATAIAYLHPFPGTGAPPKPPAASAGPVAYTLAGMDFVDPDHGWVAAQLASGVLTVLHTSDAGGRWTSQLSHPGAGRTVYLKFFDQAHGLVALLGVQPVAFRTSDGGRTWESQPLLDAGSDVISISFIGPLSGWELVRGDAGQGAELYRTADGGSSWSNLGRPALAQDEPYRVQFTDDTTGWLDAAAAQPYVYRSLDGGASWTRIALPAPDGWPRSGQFFVSVQPTQGFGVVATVVPFPPPGGRSGLGATVVAYPPLTVHTYDGGSPVSYVYTIWNADLAASAPGQLQAPNQVQFGSLDGGGNWTAIAAPTRPGAIGYSTAQDWWWIGSGAWSTTTDGGMTWTPYRNVGVLQPLPGSLEVLQGGHAWFAASAGSRSVLESTDDGGVTWRMVILPAVSASGRPLPS